MLLKQNPRHWAGRIYLSLSMILLWQCRWPVSLSHLLSLALQEQRPADLMRMPDCNPNFEPRHFSFLLAVYALTVLGSKSQELNSHLPRWRVLRSPRAGTQSPEAIKERHHD
jgi:hypothetical protein